MSVVQSIHFFYHRQNKEVFCRKFYSVLSACQLTALLWATNQLVGVGGVSVGIKGCCHHTSSRWKSSARTKKVRGREDQETDPAFKCVGIVCRVADGQEMGAIV